MSNLNELAEVFAGIQIDPSQRSSEGQYLILRPSNIIIRNNTIVLTNNDTFVNEIKDEISVLREGDIVVSLKGCPCRIGLYTQVSPPAIADLTIAVIRPRANNDAHIVPFLLSEEGRREIERRMRGQVLRYVNLKDLGSIEVPVLE